MRFNKRKILKKEINAEVLIKNLIETIQQGIENLKLVDLPLLNAKNLKKPDELIINKLKKIL